MSEQKETVGKTLLVALILCLVCSSVVATAAILLKPRQVAAQEQDRAINILRIGGLYQPGVPLAEQMEQVTPRVVNLETGKFSDDLTPEQAADTRKVVKNPETSTNVSGDADIAKINRRENYGVVYLAEQDGALQRVILPIRGYGLWSTLWGYLALEPDLNTVAGMGYYQHAETPGLGGEVDNPAWKAQWHGKKIFKGDEIGHDVAIRVLKGQVDPNSPNADYQIDGLSGATLTGKGVDNMLHYWLGEQGYGKFLRNLKAGEA